MEMRKSSHGHGARPRNPGAIKKHQKGNKKSGKLQDPGANRSGADNVKDAWLRGKIRKINDALDKDPVDVEVLRNLAISKKGFVTNDLRCKVWSKLLNVNIFEMPKKKKAELELEEFKENKYFNQVVLDVNRSHRRFPPGTRVSRKRVLQRQLTSIIMRVICRNPDLHYYQGYHDIAVTLLLVVGEDLAMVLLEQLSLHHIRDFMDVNMERTNRMLALIHPIISKMDEELGTFLLSLCLVIWLRCLFINEHVLRSEVGQLFGLSWLITWFGHSIDRLEVIIRLFDVFMASSPTMPIYIGAALIAAHKEKVMEVECEMCFVHHFLSKLPSGIHIKQVEDLISEAQSIMERHPPDSLRREIRYIVRQSSSIARHSELVLKASLQKPDTVLRKRKMFGQLVSNGTALVPDGDIQAKQLANSEPNPYVKFAVWTLTLSMGAMTFLVFNASKRWLP